MKTFLTQAEEKQVVDAIAAVETKTSGEIHVHLCSSPVSRHGVMADAVKIFKNLNLDRTRQRNGVVIYISVKDRKFAILGDRGIHEKVGASGWDAIAQRLREHFVKDQRAQGLVAAIESIGKVLTVHFPPLKDNAGNELANEISRS